MKLFSQFKENAEIAQRRQDIAALNKQKQLQDVQNREQQKLQDRDNEELEKKKEELKKEVKAELKAELGIKD